MMSISKVLPLGAFLATTMTTPFVEAGSGSTILSHYRSVSWSGNSSNQADTELHLSNISAETVTVTVTFFDDYGNVISDSGNNSTMGKLRASNVTNYSENATDYSTQFDLAAGNTTRVRIDLPNTSITRGYAVVKWESDNIQTNQALVGHAMVYRNYSNNIGYYGVELNNGAPF